jgi:hypothetical protein
MNNLRLKKLSETCMEANEYHGYKEEFFNTLANLSGHIETRSPEEEDALKTLQETLSRILPGEDLADLKQSSYSIESSDLFFTDSIKSEYSQRLAELSETASGNLSESDLRVFVRDVPVRSTQIKGSVPLWAAGAAVEKSVGPFHKKDGRQVWFDFYKVEKLIAIYIQGQADPAILFNVSLVKKAAMKTLPSIDLSTKYNLVKGSVWINSKFIAVDSPAGFYTGLKIKGGEINLSSKPVFTGSKLTVTPSTKVKVNIELDNQADVVNDDSVPYGIDAKNLSLDLPDRLILTFSGSGGNIDEVSGRISWKIYGSSNSFQYNSGQAPVYNTVLNRVMIPLKSSSETFTISQCMSPFNKASGSAHIESSAWALPSGQIDVTKPSPAAGIGGLTIKCKKGLSVKWPGLKENSINLAEPFLLGDPGRIGITDLSAGNKLCSQEYKLYKDDKNPYISTVKLQYKNAFPFYYNTLSTGFEMLLAQVNAQPLLDRPVTVTGTPLAISSQNSLLLLAAGKNLRTLYLYDDNILFDNYDPNKPKETLPKPLSLALNNGFFKVTPVNGFLLFGELAEDFIKVKTASVFLTFGMYAYLPTLPDPYAANLNRLKYQLRRTDRTEAITPASSVWLWLVCRVKWEPGGEEKDIVNVSFHFAPLKNQFQIEEVSTAPGGETAPVAVDTNLANQPFVKLFSSDINTTALTPGPVASEISGFEEIFSAAATNDRIKIDYDEIWHKYFSFYLDDVFALLDVSSNADQLGVSFASFGNERYAMMQRYAVTAANSQFPVSVSGMDVVSRGIFAKAFMLPQISWEPVLNLTDPAAINPADPQLEPPVGFNYYPNDGGAARIINTSVSFVPLAPIPLTDFIIDKYKNEKGNITASFFTLPWGMRALAVLNKDADPIKPAEITKDTFSFPNNTKMGIQIRFNAGMLSSDTYPLFHGGTLQLNNILNSSGQKTYTANLGDSVTYIFNQEFVPKLNDLVHSRGVPLTRVDFSGYGASMFSNWFNPDAQFAQTSQAKFDVFVGRTAHEVIQVRSMIYPWGIRVVRTIILYRSGSGYVFRVDTGWKAESDGIFDFTYRLKGHPDFPAATKGVKVFKTDETYKIHPGVISGLFNIKNITEIGQKFPVPNSVKAGGYYVDANNIVQKNNSASPMNHPAMLKQVEFDCDIEIEDVKQGAVNGRVPARKMVGFVQLAPMGTPLSQDGLEALHILQGGSIGGPVDCLVDIGKNGQMMRINRIDCSNAKNAAENAPVFAAAARGNIILPKDGSWSIVTHSYSTGEVTPLPANVTAPLIRIGQIIANVAPDPNNPEREVYTLTLDVDKDTQLLRIANPTEILRQPTDGTINYGFLQSTGSQKALFLTPSFQKLLNAAGTAKLLSKTPPLFSDAYRMISSKSIFPNIGNAVTSFGDVIALNSNFVQNAVTDAGKQVFELMQINQKDAGGAILKEGYKLLKQAANLDFPLPSRWDLINEDFLKIYVEYKTDRKVNGSSQTDAGKLNFDIDSFTNTIEDTWKSRMSNLSMVLDLGPFERLMIIKGNFDSKKGSETSFKGADGDPTFPSPQVEFSPVLQTVMDILQILQDLQGAKYGDAIKKGLKIAMSNSADSWEYKFDASKEIPVVKFPIPDAVYNAPTTPLKLEASLKIGVYFNSALMITSSPGKLLPTAGAYVDFYGRLQVMCVSLAAATVYAIGQVNLGIAADTKVGPSLRMKFGFGAQIVVGLPVIANVSIMFVAGVEIYADSQSIIVTASLLFQGHADVLGGIVSVTITIEAKGSVKRIGSKTDCQAQVTFALEISVFLIIDITISESWQENRQIA